MQPSEQESLRALVDQLTAVLSLWEAMKHSDLDDAAEDADRFQTAFYTFTEAVLSYVKRLPSPPPNAEAARTSAEFAPLFELLPDELAIPFESELDTELAGRVRNVDATE